FGCTLGRHALFFAMHGYEVSACDSNPANLAFTEQAARRQGISINLWELTTEAIDQHRCRYDYVLGWQLFDSTGSHDLSGSLSKLGGLLRPGGMAQLSLPEQPTRMPFHIAANSNDPNRTNTKQQSVTYARLSALTLTSSLVDAGLETIDLHLKRGPQTPHPYWHIIAEKPF
ncbi:MAG: methyltransferase domain-containing protein, partial [Pseudomonadota bacterium]|nr:methyltransferase domain-containing protein [Pseudomonadota bacterium]